MAAGPVSTIVLDLPMYMEYEIEVHGASAGAILTLARAATAPTNKTEMEERMMQDEYCNGDCKTGVMFKMDELLIYAFKNETAAVLMVVMIFCESSKYAKQMSYLSLLLQSF